jgi:hypothetical protein
VTKGDGVVFSEREAGYLIRAWGGRGNRVGAHTSSLPQFWGSLP